MKAKYSVIEKRMAELGWTQARLARACKKSHPTIWETLRKVRGGQEVSPRIIGTLAKALKVKVEDLADAGEDKGERAA